MHSMLYNQRICRGSGGTTQLAASLTGTVLQSGLSQAFVKCHLKLVMGYRNFVKRRSSAL